MTAAKTLWKFILLAKYSLIAQAVLCLAWSLKEALFPYFVKNIVNHLSSYQVGESLEVVYSQILVLVGVWLLMEISLRVQGFIGSNTFPVLRGKIREYVFDKLSSRSLQYHQENLSGTLAAKITGLPSSVEKVLEIMVLHMPAIGGAFLIGCVLLYQVSSQFAVFTMSWAAIHLLVQFLFAQYCIKKSEGQADSEYALNGKITESISNNLTTRLYSTKIAELERFKVAQKDEVKRAKTARLSLEIPKLIQSAIAVSFMASMMFSLIRFWKLGLVSVGDFALVPMLSFSIVGMVTWFGFHINTFFKELGYIRSALSILHGSHDETINKTSQKMSFGIVTVKDLSFHYPSKKKVFTSLNLVIRQNDKIGLVGQSGIGKSTFIKILSGLLREYEGEIDIDGQNLRHFSVEEIANVITVVPQTPQLYSASIFENIAFGSSHATMEQVIEVSRLVEAHGFITSLPSGYDTQIGEQGCNISLGQAQRIALARALLRDAKLLILDESTSALDAETEMKIFSNIQAFFAQKTLLLISHHLRTLKFCDRFYSFLNDGLQETDYQDVASCKEKEFELN